MQAYYYVDYSHGRGLAYYYNIELSEHHLYYYVQGGNLEGSEKKWEFVLKSAECSVVGSIRSKVTQIAIPVLIVSHGGVTEGSQKLGP